MGKFEITFKLGEEFEEVTRQGQKVMSTITETSPNIFKHEMRGTGGAKDSTCVREFMADKMKCVCTVEDVVTTRVYKRM